MAYKLLKKVIERGGYDRADIANKLDAYLAYNRITVAQYEELMAMMGEDTAAV